MIATSCLLQEIEPSRCVYIYIHSANPLHVYVLCGTCQFVEDRGHLGQGFI